MWTAEAGMPNNKALTVSAWQKKYLKLESLLGRAEFAEHTTQRLHKDSDFISQDALWKLISMQSDQNPNIYLWVSGRAVKRSACTTQ